MPKVQRYVSNELAHFVGRNSALEDRYPLLIHILKSGWLTHPPHHDHPTPLGGLHIDPSKKPSKNDMYNPEMVCFCDIPVEDLHIHTSKYSSFGLSFSKDFIVKKGGRPVFYLPCDGYMPAKPTYDSMHPDGLFTRLTLGEYFDRMVCEYDNVHSCIPLNLREFCDLSLFSYIKFFNHSLADEHSENYYMEREWRVVGNVRFKLNEVRRIFVPSDYGRRLRDDFPQYCGQLSFMD